MGLSLLDLYYNSCNNMVINENYIYVLFGLFEYEIISFWINCAQSEEKILLLQG